jgi:MFS family permease
VLASDSHAVVFDRSRLVVIEWPFKKAMEAEQHLRRKAPRLLGATGWMVFGALGGGAILGLAFATAVFILDVHFSDLWGLYWLIGCGMVGLVLGGILGGVLPRMTRAGRTAFGALFGGGIVGTLGGFALLLVGGSEARELHGGRQFVIGAVVGGIVGLALGGLLGAPFVDQ